MAWTIEDYERLGDYVTSARVRAGMDRTDLARGAEISLRTLADIENGELGKRKAFSSETLEAIALCVGWKPGGWRTILNGGEPSYLDSNTVVIEEDDTRNAPEADEAIDDMLDVLPAFDKLSQGERRLIVDLVQAMADRSLLADDVERLAARRTPTGDYTPGQKRRRAIADLGEESQDPEGTS
jgi:DNA-binding XRE family transcriptional regulator